MEGLVGGALGRYTVTALVGRGGMATVYRAFDPRLEREVAIKVLHPHLSADPAFVGRFGREARTVAGLRHPNIVRVLDFDSQGDVYFMVMEYIDGPTLATLLASRADSGSRLSPAEVTAVFVPLCSAIDYAADRGMLHRDIKPANIMLTSAGEPVLMDYGIAKIAGTTSLTTPGMVVGSAHYMSPEQAQGLDSDRRSDLYSLAVVLFEAVTGRVPFDGDTTGSVLAQHICAPVPAARAINPGLPPAMDEVLARALAKEPGGRYARGSDLGAAIQTAVFAATTTQTREEPVVAPLAATPAEPAAGPPPPNGAGHPEGVVAGPAPAATPGGARSRSRSWALAAGVIAAAALGVGAFIVLGGGTDGPEATLTTVSTAPATTAVPPTSVTEPPPRTGDSTTVEPTMAQADALWGEGRLQEAAAAYDRIVRSDPGAIPARIRLGTAYMLLRGSAARAEDQFVAVLEREPEHPAALAFVGQVRFSQIYAAGGDDFAPAEEPLRRAIELDPANAQAHGFMGEVLAAQGRLDEGLAEADRGVDLAPEDMWTTSSLGYVRALRGEWAESLDPYRRAVAAQPNLAYLHLLLADALRHTQQWEESLAACQRALELGQGHEERAYVLKGQTLWRSGDTEGAVAAFEAALQLDQTDPAAHWGMGATLYHAKRHDQALGYLQRAVELAPQTGDYHGWLGACLYALKRYPEAKAELSLALELDPGLTDAQDLLRKLEEAGY